MGRLSEILRKGSAENRMIPAKPTRYEGIQFRSRLEARWAKFFDLCGWAWEYEPFDMHGWIPDFVLRGTNSVLVEVKPFNPSNLEAFSEAIKKAETAWSKCWREFDVDHLLLLGSSPNFGRGELDDDSLGWLSESIFDYGDPTKQFSIWICRAPIGVCLVTGKVDFCHEYGSFRGRMFGGYPGGHYPEKSTIVAQNWAKACNLTQWRAPL